MRDKSWYGCRRDARDANDRLFAVGQDDLSPVDLRQWLPPVMDQGPAGSCTANGSTAYARWHIIKRAALDPTHGTYDFPMSRLQLYWDSRFEEGTENSDSGAEIRDVIKTLAVKGVGHEDLWPYDVSRLTEKPPQPVYDDAVQYRGLTYERVAVSAVALRSALHKGLPVLVGFSVYESFESEDVATTGVVPMPVANEPMVGGHCVLCVGWGQKAGHFTCRNSWGEDWGDKGNFYIPEAYLGSPTYGADYWVIDIFGSDAEKAAGTA